MTEIKRLKYCCNNEWKESKTNKYMPVTNSSTGEIIAKAPCCTPEEVSEAIAAAKAAYATWSTTSIQSRTQLMFKFKQKLDQHLDELAMLISVELGKTLDEARGEVIKSTETVELACAAPLALQGDSLLQISDGHDIVHYRVPMGVFAGIVPYNFPIMMPYWMIPISIVCGNTFVLKAASQVPQSAMRVLELLIEAGLPPGVLNIVTCSRNEAEIFLRHPDIKGISYVGSTGIGKHIYTTAAANGKRVQANCEAKNHALVLRDAPLERVAQGVANSTVGCAGQRCMALPVVVVEEEVADEFIAHLVKYVSMRKIGCAYDPVTELGPVVSSEHRQFVHNWIAKGVKEGAELILDGRDVVVPGFENGFFVGPTIFDHVTPEMSVGDEEIFGPVTCIKRVKNFEEGVALIHRNRFGNGTCIFTQNGSYAREFLFKAHSGNVGINVGIPIPYTYFNFAGHKDSFFGDLHTQGKDAFAFYTESLCVTSRWFNEADLKVTRISTWEGVLSKT